MVNCDTKLPCVSALVKSCVHEMNNQEHELKSLRLQQICMMNL